MDDPLRSPIRKRMKRWEIDRQSRFVTFSCEQRLPLLANPRIADLFMVSLDNARARFGFELFACVVMPEHVHLLVRLGGEDGGCTPRHPSLEGNGCADPRPSDNPQGSASVLAEGRWL